MGLKKFARNQNALSGYPTIHQWTKRWEVDNRHIDHLPSSRHLRALQTPADRAGGANHCNKSPFDHFSTVLRPHIRTPCKRNTVQRDTTVLETPCPLHTADRNRLICFSYKLPAKRGTLAIACDWLPPLLRCLRQAHSGRYVASHRIASSFGLLNNSVVDSWE